MPAVRKDDAGRLIIRDLVGVFLLAAMQHRRHGHRAVGGYLYACKFYFMTDGCMSLFQNIHRWSAMTKGPAGPVWRIGA